MQRLCVRLLLIMVLAGCLTMGMLCPSSVGIGWPELSTRRI